MILYLDRSRNFDKNVNLAYAVSSYYSCTDIENNNFSKLKQLTGCNNKGVISLPNFGFDSQFEAKTLCIIPLCSAPICLYAF